MTPDDLMFKPGLMKGQRILVTGGGTGLGKSMAARFLELGAELHICGRRKIVCDETATELMDLHGGRVTSHGVDIRNALAAEFGPVPLDDVTRFFRDLEKTGAYTIAQK